MGDDNMVAVDKVVAAAEEVLFVSGKARGCDRV